MANCSSCNAKVTNAKFCPNCGVNLNIQKQSSGFKLNLKNSKLVLVALSSVLILLALVIGSWWFWSTGETLSVFNDRLALHNQNVAEVNSVFSTYSAVSLNKSKWGEKVTLGNTYLQKANVSANNLKLLVSFLTVNRDVLQQRGVAVDQVLASLRNDNSSIQLNRGQVYSQISTLNNSVALCNRATSDFNSLLATYETDTVAWNSLSNSCDSASFEQKPFCVQNSSIQLSKLQNTITNVLSFLNSNSTLLETCDFNVQAQRANFTQQLSTAQSSQHNLPTVRLNQVIRVNVAPLPDWANQKYASIPQAAFSYWPNRVNVSFAVDPNGEISWQWLKEFGSEVLGHVVNTNFVQIALGDSNCLGEWKPYSYDTVNHIATHEMGHVIGFGHSPDSTDIMYANAPTKYDYDFQKTDVVIAPRHVSFVPVCTHNPSALYSFQVTSDKSLTIYIIQSRSDYDNYVATGQATSISGCSSSNSTTSLSTQCTVPQGAGLLIANPSALQSANTNMFIKEN